MDKRKNEAMITKFSEKLAIFMLKIHRKFCRRGLTHLDATPKTVQILLEHPVCTKNVILTKFDLDKNFFYFPQNEKNKKTKR